MSEWTAAFVVAEAPRNLMRLARLLEFNFCVFADWQARSLEKVFSHRRPRAFGVGARSEAGPTAARQGYFVALSAVVNRSGGTTARVVGVRLARRPS